MCGSYTDGLKVYQGTSSSNLTSDTFKQVTVDELGDMYVLGNTNGNLSCLIQTQELHTHTLVKHEKVEATNTASGMQEYYTCSSCNKNFSDLNCENEITDLNSLVIAKLEHKHTLVKHEKVEATSTTSGMQEYYTCSSCNKNFSDADAKNEITNISSLVIPQINNSKDNTTQTDPAKSTSNQGLPAGTIVGITFICIIVVVFALYLLGYFFLFRRSKLDNNWLRHLYGYLPKEGNITMRSTIILISELVVIVLLTITILSVKSCKSEKHTHTLSYTNAVASTTKEKGHEGYYTCDSCGKHFKDSEGLEEINLSDIELPLHVHYLTHAGYVEPTCSEKGNIEYYYCSSCGHYYIDQNGESEVDISSIYSYKDHVYGPHYDNIEVTCETDGYYKHKCVSCGYVEYVYETALGHNIQHTDRVEPTDTEDGTIECYTCLNCKTHYSDQDGKNILSDEQYTISKLGHANILHQNRIDSTCTTEGTLEYYECDRCHKKYSDSNLMQELDSITIPCVPHTYSTDVTKDDTNHYFTCTICGNKISEVHNSNKLFNDSINHYYGCSVCDYVSASAQKVGHTYNEGKCSVCNFDATTLTKIIIPDGVTTISANAFKGLTNLKSIVIPSSITSIESNAFDGCTALSNIYYKGSTSDKTNISISNGNDNLSSAHWNYYSETKPSDTTNRYWHGDDSNPAIWQELEYTLSADGKYYIVSGIGTVVTEEVVVPSTYNNLPVKEIGLNAFRTVDFITSISLPDSIVAIGESAFYNCENLASINIPNTVTSIPNGCLEYSKLTSLYIPKSITSIGDFAFEFCYSLKTLYYEGSETEWNNISKGLLRDDYTGGADHYNVIYNVSGIENNIIYTYISETDSYSVIGLYNKNVEEIVIPSKYNDKNVTTIANSAFKSYTFKNITLPDTLTTIEDSAFESSSLTDIIIPLNVTTLGANSFLSCSNLINAILPKSVTSIGEKCFRDSGLRRLYYFGSQSEYGTITKDSQYNADGTTITYDVVGYLDNVVYQLTDTSDSYKVAGTYNSTITELTIPSTYNGLKVISISSGAFNNGDNKIVKMILPDGLTTIESSAFDGSKTLKEINIPSTVTSIGAYAFCYTGLEEVVVPSSVTELTEAVFMCTQNGIKKIYIPTSITKINDEALAYNKNMEVIYLGTKDEFANIEITTSGVDVSQAWDYNCGDYTIMCTDGEYLGSLNYTLNGDNTYSVSGIGTYKLSEIEIPSTYKNLPVTSISGNAFYNIKKITKVTLPDTITSIGATAFYKCSNLTYVNIPSGVTTLRDSSFSGISNLKMLITKNLTTLDSYCLMQTKGTVYYEGSKDEWSDINKPDEGTSAAWNSGASISVVYNVAGLDNNFVYSYISETDTYAVKGLMNTDVEEVTIPSTYNGKNVTSIENDAFTENKTITQVTIPNTITSIGTSAFAYCTGLKYIEIPSGVTTIQSNTFARVKYSLKLYLPKTVTTFDKGCFESANFAIYYEGSEDDWNNITKNGSGSAAWNSEANLEITYNCNIGDDFIYELSEDNNSYSIIYLLNKTSKELTIPATYNTLPVTTIGYRVFDENCKVEKVVLPEGLTTIEHQAFNACKTLKKVNIPSTVTSIGEHAFCDCKNLGSFVIPNNFTEISWGMLDSCGLNAIYIPSTVTKICKTALASNPNIKIVYGGTEEQWNNVTKETETMGDWNEYSDGLTVIYNCIIDNFVAYTLNSDTNTYEIVSLFGSNDDGSFDLVKSVKDINVSGFSSKALYNNSNVTTINFNGTKDEWNQLTFATDWRDGSCLQTVNCSDGEVKVAYKVTFNSGKGSEVASQYVAPNGLISKPTDPTITSGTFDAWYTSNQYSTKWDFDNDTVTSDITLYARWYM